MKVVPNKKYMTRGKGEIILLSDLTNPITGIKHEENGYCGCNLPDCAWDIIAEVDEGSIDTQSIESDGTIQEIVREVPSKQNLFELTLDIPQDAMTFVLTKKVEVNGISYLAKIELERV